MAKRERFLENSQYTDESATSANTLLEKNRRASTFDDARTAVRDTTWYRDTAPAHRHSRLSTGRWGRDTRRLRRAANSQTLFRFL